MIWLLLVAIGCGPEEPPEDPVESPALDLSERLGPGEVRAGVITDPEVLPAGLSAEGSPGDVLLYNDRVKFVVQGLREGNYYVSEWGGVLDADVVREPGEPERDIVEKWLPMVGIGRITDVRSVEVVQDGQDGEAVVRVVGTDVALGLIEGALESPGFIPHLDLEIEHVFRLKPDVWWVEVETVVRAPSPAEAVIADVMFGAPESTARYTQGGGFSDGEDRWAWTGYLATHDASVAMIMSQDPGGLSGSGLGPIGDLVEIAVAGTEPLALGPDQEVRHRRWYAVGRSMADLTDAWIEEVGLSTQTVEGVVEGPSGPLADAWVQVLVDGAPWTLTTSGEDGGFSVQAPADAEVKAVAVGERTGLFVDVPDGSRYAPYADPVVRERTLERLRQEIPRTPVVEGRGAGSEEAPTTLGAAGSLVVTVSDGAPFAVHVYPKGSVPRPSSAWTPGRPSRLSAAGWSRGGPLRLDVSAGEHDVLVHRGGRYEWSLQTVEVAEGAQVPVDAELSLAYDHAGWLVADPHSHASPSSDGRVPMEDRLVVFAAGGIQVHIGTDHDHAADYRPLVDALGLSDHLVSVIANEVSPVLRGHINVYPIQSLEGPSGGVWRWWRQMPESTEWIMDKLRQLHGEGAIIQYNHPLSGGVPSSAGWSAGRVRSPEFWSDRLQTVEVANRGRTDAMAVWWDVVPRGIDVTPVAVSDSHGHLSGDGGLSVTFVEVGGPDGVAGFDDDAFAEAMRRGRVVASRGPFLRASLEQGHAPLVGSQTLEVSAHSPSWMGVDRLILWRDGEEVERQEGSEAVFELDPDQDAVYAVTAEGDRPMAPLASQTPWALIGPFKIDVDGDGWQAPWPPLQVGR